MARREEQYTRVFNEKHYTCDVCGKDLGDGDKYDAKKVDISYMDDGVHPQTEVSFDICTECFWKHVEPVLGNIGAFKYEKTNC